MTDDVTLDREPTIAGEETKKIISSSIRQALEMNREISRGDHGEGPKSVSVVENGRTYRFYKDYAREGSEWAMEVTDEKGMYVETVDISDDADVEYLEDLFKQDISEGLRVALNESRDVSYEEYGEKKVVSVKYGGKIYKFYRDDSEYAEWSRITEDEKGKFEGRLDIREQADVEYLENLFKQDISEGLRAALEESRQVSYEEYGEKKVVSVQYSGKTYKFRRDPGGEYSDWLMTTENEKGEYLDSVGIREESDVKYLEELFETLTRQEQIGIILDES